MGLCLCIHYKSIQDRMAWGLDGIGMTLMLGPSKWVNDH